MKILIAEDEFFSRKALIKTITSSGLEVSVSAACATGAEALEYLKEHTVDLVITDICMPKADGLEISKFICENCPDTKVILVTGYADFSYAQQAIKYRVLNYITKPVKDPELLSAIQEVLADKVKEQKELQLHEDSLIASTVLNSLSASQLFDNPQLRQIVFKDFSEILETTPWRMFLAQSSSPAQTEAAGKRLSAYFAEFSRVFQCYLKRSDEHILLLAGKSAEKELYANGLKPFLHRLALTEGVKISIGASRLYESASELKNAYEDCISSISQRLWEPETHYGFFPFIESSVMKPVLYNDLEFVLRKLLSARDFSGIQNFIDDLFQQMLTEKPDCHSLEEMLFQIYMAVNYTQIRRKTDSLSPSQLRADFFIHMSQFRKLEELKKHLLDILERVCRGNSTHANREIAEEMMTYIQENYAYNISLNELSANHFFMNSNYLGRLFKSHTGTTFSQYLIDCRISCAKQLLKNTDIKISDIAVRVGFSTTSHFGYTFKKCVKCTPEQYRKSTQALQN